MHPDTDTDTDADTDTDTGTIGPIIRVRVWFLWQLFKSLASATLQLCLANKLFAYLTQIVAPTAEQGEGGGGSKWGRGIISTAAFNENVAKVSATKCCSANVAASFAAVASASATASATIAAAAAGNLNLQLYNFR